MALCVYWLVSNTTIKTTYKSVCIVLSACTHYAVGHIRTFKLHVNMKSLGSAKKLSLKWSGDRMLHLHLTSLAVESFWSTVATMLLE